MVHRLAHYVGAVFKSLVLLLLANIASAQIYNVFSPGGDLNGVGSTWNSQIIGAGKVTDSKLSLTTPALGTPSSVILTNATGLPAAGVIGPIINAQTGTTYTVLSTDAAKLVTFNNVGAVAVTLPQATTAGFGAGFSFIVSVLPAAGNLTITPTTSTINGAATLLMGQNTSCTIISDGTNYLVSGCYGPIAASVTTLQSYKLGLSVIGGTISLNASSNAAVNVGTGTNTNLVTVGGGSNGVVINSNQSGSIKNTGLISTGTKFTTSGCSVSSTTGGATAGIFTLGANTCTVVITMNGATGLTSTNGWTCQAHDRTSITAIIDGESSSTTTTASIVIPATAGTTDIISFSCTGF
jgi:hypothetical protein